MIRVDVNSTFEPIIGSEVQSKELIDYLMRDYENGVYEPSIDTLIKMAGIYGASLNYLLLKEDKSITFTNKEIDIIEKFAFVLIDKLQLLKIKEKLTNEEL